GMVHWKMLKRNATVNKELYAAQLHRVNKAIRLKDPIIKVILLHGNAWTHVTKVVKNRTAGARMGILQHPLVSGPCTIGLSPFPLSIKSNSGYEHQN
ncbi:Mariner mos1 transposase, partial [Caligus rogercresseyi]